jgi:hypothetical protein
LPQGFESEFFECMLNESGQLKSTYCNLSEEKLRSFAKLPSEGLPPTDY